MTALPLKILCVDDDPDLLQINTAILRNAGYEVTEAATGKECLRITKEQHPDLYGWQDFDPEDVRRDMVSFLFY